MAEPSDRAGLTDEPVSVERAKWIATSASAIAMPACEPARLVAVRMTTRKNAVKAVSRISALTSLMPGPGLVMPALTASWLIAIRTIAAAAIAPMIWAMM